VDLQLSASSDLEGVIMATATTTAPTRVNRHPIRGAMYGISTGIGVAMYLVLFSVTPFRWETIIVILVLGMILGALWGSLAPAKKPEGPAPTGYAFGSNIPREDTDGPAPTYEESFGTTTPVSDDGSFGAPTSDVSPADIESEVVVAAADPGDSGRD
ncbi:MAG: hypothetical protein ACR2PK_10060, partial [Acidimicrobiales bacterium]